MVSCRAAVHLSSWFTRLGASLLLGLGSLGGAWGQAAPVTGEQTAQRAHQLTFTATAAGLDAELHWVTAREWSCDYFVIERSLDGTLFSPVGVMQGSGTRTTPTSYTWTDAAAAYQAIAGVPVYYLLRQVDYYEAIIYSPVQRVLFPDGLAVGRFPSPAGPSATLRLPMLPGGDYHLELLSLTGHHITTFPILGAHLPLQPLDLRTIPAGTYLLHINAPGAQQTLLLRRK